MAGEFDEMLEEYEPRPARSWETCRALVAAGFVPYARMEIRGREMELISMPFVQDGVSIHGGGCGIGIKVRAVPDDPTTMTEWSIPRRIVRLAVEAEKRRSQKFESRQNGGRRIASAKSRKRRTA